MIRIDAGSRAFFSGIEEFTPHDFDTVCIIENEKVKFLFKRYYYNKKMPGCEFHIVKMDKDRLIRWELKHSQPMSLGHYLMPEFCKVFDITVDDLPKLKPLRDRLDKKHQYEGIIYDYYLENGEMTLTNEQRLEAYDEYKKERNIL